MTWTYTQARVGKPEVTGKLNACGFGIVVVTADNQTSPWLKFEAGALSKSVRDSRVVPLLVDLKKSDLLLPLNMFQAEVLDKDGIASLIASLNETTEESLPSTTVALLAAKWWGELEAAVATIASEVERKPTKPERSDRELVEELVTMVRTMRNAGAHAPESLPSRPLSLYMKH